MTRATLRRPVTVAALLALAAGSSVALGAPPLTVKAGRDGSTLSLGGVSVTTTKGRIVNQRALEFPGSSTVMLTWQEYAGSAAPVSWYGISLDGGRTIAQTATTENRVRLRYADFDPLTAGEPAVHPDLRAGEHNELYLVQFVGTPLEEMRGEIRALGGEVLRFMTENTHVIRMAPGARDAVAQLPYVRWVGAYHPAYRLDETSRAWHAAGDMARARYSIECMHSGPADQTELAAFILKMGGEINVQTLDQFRTEATLTREQLLAVAQLNIVNFIDPWLGPGGPDMDLIRQTGGAVPLLSTLPQPITGQGVRGEIFDTGIINAHQQWGGQQPLINGATASDSHGVACYGVNFATGTGNANATGLCPNREQGIFSYYAETTQFGAPPPAPTRLALNTAAVNAAGTFRSCYQTSSVGSARTTTYTTISAEVDDYLFKVDYLSCQSQSNAGNRQSRPQAWAKNIVSVGGLELNETITRDDDEWATGASIGPAADLRVKPDLSHSFGGIFTTYSTSNTGYGQFGGTSGATPITAGHFGLLHQMWHRGLWTLNTGNPSGGAATVFASRPKSATAKALMINGAYRYPIDTPSTNSMYRGYVGWGSADLAKLYNGRAKVVVFNQPQSEAVTNAQTRTYIMTVAQGEAEFRATMIYPDPPGNPTANQHRINDLTLKVTDPNGVVYWGNNGMVPTGTAGPSQKAGGNWSVAGGNANTYDTVENVFVENPAPGGWKVEVIGSQIVADGFLTTPAVDAVFSLVAAGVTPGPPPPLTISFPQPLAELVPPGEPTNFVVKVEDGTQTVVPGSPTFWYRPNGGASFVSTAMVALGNDEYQATLPSQVCANDPQFYFTASGSGGANVASPPTAPVAFYSADVGVPVTTTLFSESFESGLPAGWTTSGLWNINSTCPADNACDGTNWAYYGLEASCSYSSPTASTGDLVSPSISLAQVAPGEPITLSYCSAKLSENNPNFDVTTVIVNGEVVDTATDSGPFEVRTADLGSFAGQTVTITFRFDSVDATLNTYRGWHVDHIRITTPGVECQDGPPCYANCDGSSSVPVLNVADFSCFLAKFAAGDPYANCDASVQAPVLNILDFTCYLGQFAAGCP